MSNDRPNASSDMMDHCMEYHQRDAMSDLHMGVDVAEEGADQTAVMIVYLGQGHTIKEWFILLDDVDAYVEFLESLLVE